MEPESGASNIDNNLLIGTNLSTITTTDTDNYKNVTVIGHGAKARGDYVTAVGSFAGNSLESETDGLTAYGYEAGRRFKGSWNTAVGYQTMGGAFTSDSSATNNGTQNAYFGHRAGGNSNGGGYNCGIGGYSLYNVENTNYQAGGNVGVGYATGENLTTGIGNLALGYSAGRYLTTANNNICIGYETGPASGSDRIDDDNQLYIDTLSGYKEEDSLIYGDQSTGNQDLTFNADVVISKSTTNSTGTLEVEGGEVKIWAGGMTTDANHYKINFPKGDASGDYPYRNIQITNKNRGIGSLTDDNNQYENVMIGFNMPTNPDYKNTLIGAWAGSVITGHTNTALGAYSLYLNSSGNSNTAIGTAAGYNITSGNSNAMIGVNAGHKITTGGGNICIGYGAGPQTAGAGNDNRLYIDARSDINGKGTSSLIYGDQSGSNQDLTFNADVVISKSTTNSTGTLEVQGGNIIMKGGGDDETQNLSGQTFTSGTPLTWKMKVIKGGVNSSTFGYYTNSNLQITTDGYGLAETPPTIRFHRTK